jgi:acetyltransferase
MIDGDHAFTKENLVERPLQTTPDPAHDVLKGRSNAHPLGVFFKPRSIALIGATERPNSVGRSILWNLLSSPFGGTIFPINPKHSSILGIRAYPNVVDTPEKPELAVVAVPAKEVPQVIRDCSNAGVKAAIIISAGFKERGAEGSRLEQETLNEARRGGIRLIGPNCMGVMSPPTGLNATFAKPIALPGSVAFLSQSGALCSAILDWSLREHVGFSAFVSIGSMADVGWGDLIDYFGDDPKTRSIIVYMETIGNPRAFLSAARQVALSKPIIVLKGGRTAAAAEAASSHTGAMAGSDEVFDAALRRCGVLRVNSIDALFYMAEVLAKQPRPAGPRLAIVTNAGGPGVLATDSLLAAGGELARLSDETIEALNRILPPHWSHGNPVDILGDADAERFAKAVEIVSRDAESDGLLVILSPQAMTDSTRIAERVAASITPNGKPILASWMGGASVAAGESVLNRADIPTFSYPDTAVQAFYYMWRYSDNLRALYETPTPVNDPLSEAGKSHDTSVRLLHQARAEHRALLTEFESKELLRAYGIPVVETREARTEDDAISAAAQVRYPVVVKILSKIVTHKSDIGGVQLNLADEAAVRQAYRTIRGTATEMAGAEAFSGVTVQPMIRSEGYELILGSTIDPQFGPVILFGSGGRLVEVFDDHALALPPLNTTLARRMMEQTQIYKVLKGVRGRKPADLHGLEGLLVQFSELVLAEPSIKEVDINPLLVYASGMIALDARVLLHDATLSRSELPRPSIRPYPTQYVWRWKSRDGTEFLIRPIRPEDEPMVVKFHGTLSENSVYRRYFHLLSLGQRIAHERLVRLCFIDYYREIALVVEHKGAEGGPEIVAIARLTKSTGTEEAETAILVSDLWQHRGIGTETMRRIVGVAECEGVSRIRAEVLSDNTDMQHVFLKLGFSLQRDDKDHIIRAAYDVNEGDRRRMLTPEHTQQFSGRRI